MGGSRFSVPVPLRVFVSNLRVAGKLRLGLFWTKRKGGPYLKALRVSFVDMPEHSVSIKPMTSSMIDIRDLPGLDRTVENALNKMFTNVLVEPNIVLWNVERWWWNRDLPKICIVCRGPCVACKMGISTVAQELAVPGLEQDVIDEAAAMRQGKSKEDKSRLMSGTKNPTLTLAISIHLAEIETLKGTKRKDYYVKLKRGPKKFTTDGAKAAPVETLVTLRRVLVPRTGPHTTAFAWCTPILKDFSSRVSLRPGSLGFNPDTPRRPPFNST